MPALSFVLTPGLDRVDKPRTARSSARKDARVKDEDPAKSEKHAERRPSEPSGRTQPSTSQPSGSSQTGGFAESATERSLQSEKQMDSQAQTDVELLQAFQRGDERAYAELYTRRKQEIYTFCVRMLGGDRDLANDAFQECFIKVYEKAESFRSGTNVMGWLFMIARNTCLNLHRAKHPSESLDEQGPIESRDRSLGPEYGEEQHFLRQLLEDAIATLPAEFREPFILREFDGFSYGEIARMTNTTLPTTKVRIYRAKQRLRELLRPYLQDDAEILGGLIDDDKFGLPPERNDDNEV